MFKLDKRKARAEGYSDTDRTLHHSYSAIQFVQSDQYLQVLADAHELRLDGEENAALAEHPATKDEVRECLKDIKVLGRKELRELLNWRKTMRQHLREAAKVNNTEEASQPEKEE